MRSFQIIQMDILWIFVLKIIICQGDLRIFIDKIVKKISIETISWMSESDLVEAFFPLEKLTNN